MCENCVNVLVEWSTRKCVCSEVASSCADRGSSPSSLFQEYSGIPILDEESICCMGTNSQNSYRQFLLILIATMRFEHLIWAGIITMFKSAAQVWDNSFCIESMPPS